MGLPSVLLVHQSVASLLLLMTRKPTEPFNADPKVVMLHTLIGDSIDLRQQLEAAYTLQKYKKSDIKYVLRSAIEKASYVLKNLEELYDSKEGA